jgi:hypothetical protein
VQSLTFAAGDDAQWVASLTTVLGFYPAGAAFDNSGRLFTGAEGVWYTPTPPGASIVFTSKSAGIEEALSNNLITSSTMSGNLLISTWDLNCFILSKPFNTFPIYPANRGCYNPNVGGLQLTYITDWASASPSFIVSLTDNLTGGGGYIGYSGTSTDGGHTWSALNAPSNVTSSGLIGGCITAASTTNFLWAPSDGSGGNVAPYYTTNGGSTWTQISVAGFTGGWPFRYYVRSSHCTADRVLANTFYLYNWNPGDGIHSDAVVKCTSGGATCVLQSVPGLSGNRQYFTMLKAVPGQSGHIFISDGANQDGASGGLYYYTDGGVTQNTVANMKSVLAYGFGAAASGHTYPTIVAVGWYNGVYGIWQSIDWDGAKTWQQIGTYPLNIPVTIKDVDGDKVVPNVFYYSTNSGVFCSATSVSYCNGNT